MKDSDGFMASTVPFRRVAIIGTGLIGGSFALALRQIFPKISLVGFSRSGSCERARDAGVVDEATPDLAAAVSGAVREIKADVLLKGTKVEGVYDADPKLNKDAVKYDQITYMEVLRLGLKVIDLTAVSMCKDNNLPMIIFNMNEPGNIKSVVLGEKVGTLVTA